MIVTETLESIGAHKMAIMWIAGASIIAFIATLIGIPWLVVRIPSDYFAHGKRLRDEGPCRHVVVCYALLMGRICWVTS
jgi:hypothetical protein